MPGRLRINTGSASSMAAPYSPLPTMADDYVDAPRARRLDDDGDAVDSPPVKHTQMDDDNDEEEAIELEDLEAINEDDILLRSQSRDQDDRPKPTRHQRKPTADDPASIVAKVVPATDDTTLTTLTIRVFLIGCVLGGIGSAISQIAYFKSNSFGLSGFFIILVSYPSTSATTYNGDCAQALVQWGMGSLDMYRLIKSVSLADYHSTSIRVHLGALPRPA